MSDPNNTPTDGQDQNQAFTLPETFQGNELFDGIDSVEKLAKSYADTHTKVSELESSLPQIPESPDKYEIKAPEGQQVDDALIGEFKQWMHDGKVPQETAQMISDKFNGYMEKLVTDFNNQQAERLENLKKEWGSEFDSKAEAANKGLNRFFNEAEISESEQADFTSQFGNNPVAIKIFHKIGTMIAESPAFFGDGNEPKPNEAKRTAGGAPMLFDYSKGEK